MATDLTRCARWTLTSLDILVERSKHQYDELQMAVLVRTNNCDVDVSGLCAPFSPPAASRTAFKLSRPALEISSSKGASSSSTTKVWNSATSRSSLTNSLGSWRTGRHAHGSPNGTSPQQEIEGLRLGWKSPVRMPYTGLGIRN